MLRRCLIYWLWLIATPAIAFGADDALDCGGATYIVEKGFLGGAVTKRVGSRDTPFCTSDTADSLTKNLSFQDTEVWCVTLHHMSANSRPVAKNLWVLNRLSKKLYQYDYVFADGDWRLQTAHQETCTSAALPLVD